MKWFIYGHGRRFGHCDDPIISIINQRQQEEQQQQQRHHRFKCQLLFIKCIISGRVSRWLPRLGSARLGSTWHSDLAMRWSLLCNPFVLARRCGKCSSRFGERNSQQTTSAALKREEKSNLTHILSLSLSFVLHNSHFHSIFAHSVVDVNKVKRSGTGNMSDADDLRYNFVLSRVERLIRLLVEALAKRFTHLISAIGF